MTMTPANPDQPRPSILFLVDQLTELGGGERMLLTLAAQLLSHGYPVQIVCFRGDPDPSIRDIPLHIYPMRSCFRPSALRTALRLHRLIRSHQVTLVQTCFETADTFGAVVARLSGVRCILSSRRDMGILRTHRHSLAYRLLAPLYTRVLAVSSAVRQSHLAADKLRPEQIVTIYNGLNLHRFADARPRSTLRAQLGLPASVPLITTIANINAWKGLDTFVHAAALVHLRHPQAIFAIAGEWTNQPLTTQLHDLAASLGITTQLHFLGSVATTETLLLASDIFCLLSLSEGLPNAVLEAMAASLPVVATSVGGTPEVVLDGRTGYLVPTRSYSAAAAHLCTLIEQPSLRQSLGNAGRQLVENNFTLDHMVRQHMQLYDSLTHPQAVTVHSPSQAQS